MARSPVSAHRHCAVSSLLRTPRLLAVAQRWNPANSHGAMQSARRWYIDEGVYGVRAKKAHAFGDFTEQEVENRLKHANLVRLTNEYKREGYRMAQLDPLGLAEHHSKATDAVPELVPERFGIDPQGKKGKRLYNLTGIVTMPQEPNPESVPVEAVLAHLQDAYCGKIAFEFMHLPDAGERRWWAENVERMAGQKSQDGGLGWISDARRRRLWQVLTKSEVFDHFMAKRFPNVKRYGLEGAESMMLTLDTLFEEMANSSVATTIIGMPHRGRLNLLTGLLKVPPRLLFHKVRGNAEFPEDGSVASHIIGDVISHLATSVELEYGKGTVRASLLHNPSHLEAVNPVAMGKARSKQLDLSKTSSNPCYLGDMVSSIIIHGDSAFAGQGIVMESLGLSALPHFTSGGSVHVIVNNQIGYTTEAENARSTVHASDVAKGVLAPIVHVNGDSPEDVVRATKLVWMYRDTFRKDAILDLITYRRWGHNEMDEPSFTQPLMYNKIRSRPSVAALYESHLTASHPDIVPAGASSALREEYTAFLDSEDKESSSFVPAADHLEGKWAGIVSASKWETNVDTSFPLESLKAIGIGSVAVPSDFQVHSRLTKFHVEPRLKKLNDGTGLDWATAEALAWGSLLAEGFDVRISGQDVGRGTFSHRHVMFVDQQTEAIHVPLDAFFASAAGEPHLNVSRTPSAGRLEIANSNLSELAVLGFEYGMSIDNPNRLCIWEAQFGDFFNAAQEIIDTFIVSGEVKWLRQSSLVMQLPSGWEGAGPEHTSGRMERFLQLCDDRFNVLDESGEPSIPSFSVAFPTTPAQMFHLLRRQMHFSYRKPLIVFTPKSYLKHPSVVSRLDEMGPGTSWQPIVADPLLTQSPQTVDRVVFCTGKLYFELAAKRKELGLDSQVALVRLEELCPFPSFQLLDQVVKPLQGTSRSVTWVWAQEEPQNQGAWTFVEPRLSKVIGDKILFSGRTTSAVPGTGVSKWHKREQEMVVGQPFLYK
ncbi:2-oxoglutarate dehydrogenase, E1 component [Gonapodya prolifera JEL478]|uniref:2-oxoglutarate dehydrogenase, E1 component n=1 Tax=Gonapodya prolifera (strain JEL478) TaxID=1344416 RepID=A0A139ANM4_GONPJ|nr:2-oxoglutarate dehydrogenase, E1 component [Gonapodya prolifera JEL478]|eukprot:KXS18095.1 2-oxoglutarate dehydrogenase, E1 component [Gonapodya prolifera JEL478]